MIWEQGGLVAVANEEDDKVDADHDGTADVKQMSTNEPTIALHTHCVRKKDININFTKKRPGDSNKSKHPLYKLFFRLFHESSKILYLCPSCVPKFKRA